MIVEQMVNVIKNLKNVNVIMDGLEKIALKKLVKKIVVEMVCATMENAFANLDISEMDVKSKWILNAKIIAHNKDNVFKDNVFAIKDIKEKIVHRAAVQMIVTNRINKVYVTKENANVWKDFLV